MALTTNDPLDIQRYVADQLAAPVFFPPFTTSTKPMDTRWRFRGIYITTTSKPAWMDSSGTWKYADGSAV